MVEKPTGVRVYGLHKRAHTLRIHVRVQTVAEVRNVAPGAERLQHHLHNLRNSLLNTHTHTGLYLCFLSFIKPD